MKKYKEISPEFELVTLEKETLDYWYKNNIFEQVMGMRKTSEEWVYYDGPITANGIPHYGHAITWTMKDIVPRYWTMKGYYVPRNIGWDCQGILVEYEVEKALGFKAKEDIEEYGVAKFNEKCRESVLKFRESMVEYEKRLGRWLDDKQYSTMDSDYIESLWWSLKELYNKGLLYEGHKVVAYSTRAGMTLSSHEVAEGGYSEVVDPAVTVKFELIDEPGTYFLAWTTTPWTLPGNLMLAVGEKIEYCKVFCEGNHYLLATKTIEKVFEGKDYKVVSSLNSKDLIGRLYKPLYPHFREKESEGAFRVITAGHVNTEEGTGIVHLAPYGEDDFNIFLEMGIKLFDYLDDTGHFTDLIKEYQGLFYKKANPQIIIYLKENDLLFDHKDYPHQMPISYRTKEPLIYKPIKSWYVAVNKIKPRLVEEATKIRFVPKEMGQGRFVHWIKNARDWSLSRRRYWGTPLPVWINDKTGEIIFVGSYKELETLSGVKLGTQFDPHKPFVDEITWKADGGTFRRVPEVIDVWYDSGSMPFAQYHYPFENKELFEKTFPAEYISEGDDQLRLWFYTMFVLGVALFDKSPFKNVIVIGMLGDAEGKKMSKSKGNYPPVEEVFSDYGSDMLRYFLLTSGVSRGAPAAFSYDALKDTKKEFFVTLWNCYRYFVTYADLYDFNFDSDFKPKNLLDKWLLMRLNQLIKSMTEYLDNYEVMLAARQLAPFVEDLSTWYIRRSRDRLSTGDKDALNTLYLGIMNLTKMMAPFMPLLSENLYQNLAISDVNNKQVSVHAEDYPSRIGSVEDNAKLFEYMELIRKYASLGNSLRKENNLALKQPLRIGMIKAGTEVIENDELIHILKEELNIKEITVWQDNYDDNWIIKRDGDFCIGMNTVITDDLLVQGYARELIREIQKLRKEKGVNWDQKVKVQYKNDEKFMKAVEFHRDEIMKKTLTVELKEGESFEIFD